jgi:4-hydroxybenzoate polyprenyltransferase
LKIIKALIRLTRFKELTFFVTVTTLLGVASAKGEVSWQLLGVWAANWLAVVFAFMINDVEDAEDDALNPKKAKRNPVSSGELSPRLATVASFAVAAVSALLYYMLGYWPFILGTFSLFLGFVYSWKKIRLKNMAFIDLASHCMMLAGLQFLPAYLAFDHRPQNFYWLFPFTCVVAISLYGELFNELRDLEGDLKAGLRHTAAVLGARHSYWLMMLVFFIGVYCAFVTMFLLDIIATWVVIVLLVAAAVLVTAPVLKARRNRSSLAVQESIQKPIEIAGVIALGAHFVGPWAWAFIGPWAIFLTQIKLF